jgi:hypothetical protein
MKGSIPPASCARLGVRENLKDVFPVRCSQMFELIRFILATEDFHKPFLNIIRGFFWELFERIRFDQITAWIFKESRFQIQLS